MDASQWPQGIGVEHHNKAMEPAAAAASRSPNNDNNLTTGERRARPQKDQPLNCPRCNSTNTKFCYYNNYSLSQPRYFCKTCRRYWTEGGSLRNVPVGGGSRKNKRPSSSSPSTSSKKLVVPDHQHQHQHQQLVSKLNHHHHHHQDLNVSYPHHHVLAGAAEEQNPSPCSSSSPHFSAVELFKGTPAGSMSMSSFLHVAGPDSGTMFAGGFPIHDFKPTLNFSLEAFDHQGGGGGGGAHDENGARLLFPVEDLKQVPGTSHPMERDHHQIIHHHHQATAGYWTGMLGGNSW